MKKNKQELYAIWPYDSPPYWLGGKVIEVQKNGYVTVDKYTGMSFKYYKLYPLQEGEEKMRWINEAGTNYQVALHKIHSKLTEEVERILDIPKGKIWEVRKK